MKQIFYFDLGGNDRSSVVTPLGVEEHPATARTTSHAR
jgi:hypothetical protein